MKSSFLNCFLLVMLGIVLMACHAKSSSQTEKHQEIKTPDTTNHETSDVSEKSQELAKACSENEPIACQDLAKIMTQICHDNNTQACIETAASYLSANPDITKAKNSELAFQSFNNATNVLVSNCIANNQKACKLVSGLSDSIFNNLKSIQQICIKNSNKIACEVVEERKKVLTQACKNGVENDCQYLRELSKNI